MEENFSKTDLEEVSSSVTRLKEEISKVIIGQERTVEYLIAALLSDAHVLLEGVPGLGKTLMVHAFAASAGLSFSRIQFTPDLMPQDITGSEIIEERGGVKDFRFINGPIFADIVLADEINRTPPKTQSALLEAMQERQVTAFGRTYPMSDTFLVMATQNPLEHEGTYPLPEAQLDRFMFYITLGYPTEKEELSIAMSNPSERLSDINAVLDAENIKRYRKIVRALPVSEAVAKYAVEMVRNSRPESTKIDNVKKYVSYGAGPRASQYLISAAQAIAASSGADIVSRKEVDIAAPAVLRHRVLMNFQASAEGVGFTNFLKWLS